jgi:hypothetical protein
MTDTRNEFFNHVQHLQEYLSLNLSETDTRVYLIDPVLRLLGYVGVGDVRREVAVPATKEFLDYELSAGGKAQAIVEAKALRNPVTDQAAAQCVQYASVLGLRWCIITNGVTWAVYNAHATGPLSEKKVASVSLDGDEASISEAWGVLSLFARDSLAQANPLTKLLAERVILDELSKPDSPAVTALRKAIRDRFGERVTAQAVVDVVARLRSPSQLLAEVVRNVPQETAAANQPPTAGTAATKAWATRRLRQEAANQPPAVVPVAPAAEHQRARRTEVLKPDGTRVNLGDLIGVGLLPSDAVLEMKLSGVTYAGRIRDGQVEVNGELHPNLSAAATAATGGKSANGWAVWYYQGAAMAELRDEFAARLTQAGGSQGV